MNEMIEHASDSGFYLYHYTSAETALKILASGSLRMGQYRKTNDPKESKDWHFSVGVINNGKTINQPSAQRMSNWLSEKIKSSARVLCFCTDTPPLTGDHIKDIYKRGYCKPRMWAQYGDSHSGVCLIFRTEQFLEATRFRFGKSIPRFYGNVKYVNRPVVSDCFSPSEAPYIIDLESYKSLGQDRYYLQHALMHRHRLFLEKMDDWSNEREWRIVTFQDGDEEVYIPYQNSLAGVMFGERTSEETMAEIIGAAKNYSPWFMRMKWKNCTPWYDYENKLFIYQYRPQG